MEVFKMFGMTEIKKVQNHGNLANRKVEKAEGLLLEVFEFLCCNKFMRVLRFLFRKKFDEQYDKLTQANSWLISASESLDEQWFLLEDYWDQEAKEDLEENEEYTTE